LANFFLVFLKRITSDNIFSVNRYRRKRERLIERASAARLPLRWGNVRAYCYKSVIDGIEHIAMVKVSH
jgi:3,4-dihydroxy 2-butanone 4-phosphate synthase / GTP cyclohydrolase II